MPTPKRIGLTQYLANSLNLELDPWTNDFNKELSKTDQNIINYYSKTKIINFRKAIEFLEKLSEYLLIGYFFNKNY